MSEKAQIRIRASDETDAAFRSVRQGLSRIQSDAKGVGTAFAGVRTALASLGGLGASLGGPGALFGGLAGGAIVGQIAQATKGLANQADEVRRLAELSNVGAAEFQKLAAGARLVGIDQAKLADIFKDTQDKLGDFLQNGGGPLKDFFKNIAPAVGVTAEQFRKLSGPDALQLYASSLQKAGLSQAELTFYMEALASDAAKLAPLLKDGGQGFKEIGARADQFGAVLDDRTIEAAKKFREQMELLSLQMDGMKVSLFSPLVEGLADVAKAFNDARAAGLGFWNALGTDKSNIRGQIEFYEKQLAGLQKQLAAGSRDYYGRPVDTTLLERQAADAEAQLIKLRNLELTLTGAGFAPPQLPAPEGRARPRTEDPKPGKAAKPLYSEAELTREQQGLIEASKLYQGVVDEANKYAATLEALDRLYFDNAISAQVYDAAIGKLVSAQERAGADGLEQLRAQADAWMDLIDPLREFIREVEKVDQAVAFELLTPAQAAAIKKRLAEAKGDLKSMDQFAIEAARNIQDTLGNSLYDVLDGNFQNIGKSFGDMLKRITAEAMAADLGRYLLGDFAKTGSVGGALGSIFSSIFGGARAAGGPVWPGSAFLVGEKGPELFVPSGAGHIVPNGAGGGVVVNLSQSISVGKDVSAADVYRVGQQTKFDTIAAIREATARGDMSILGA